MNVGRVLDCSLATSSENLAVTNARREGIHAQQRVDNMMTGGMGDNCTADSAREWMEADAACVCNINSGRCKHENQLTGGRECWKVLGDDMKVALGSIPEELEQHLMINAARFTAYARLRQRAVGVFAFLFLRG